MLPSGLGKVTVKVMPVFSSQVPSMNPMVVASEQLRQYTPVTFVPRMYSSFYPATWAGNAHYGLAKEMATMQRQGARVVAATPDGAPLIEAACEPSGDWTAHPADLPNFGAMRAVFALPILGRRADGSFITSYFGWDFRGARGRPARAAVAIIANLGPGLGPRNCSTLESGTFEVQRMIWRLSWPTPSKF